MKKDVRLLARLTLLGVAFLCIAAPGFGGGGHGGGGFGGGIAGGGFGAGSTRLHTFGGTSGPTDYGVLAGVLGIAVVGAGAIYLYSRTVKNRLVEIVVVAKNGIATAQALDAYMAKASFDSSYQRSQCLAEVAKIVGPNLVDGWVKPVSDETRFPSSDAEEAFSLRMNQLRLKQRRRAEVSDTSHLRNVAMADDGCLVGLIFTIKGPALAGGELDLAKHLLHRLSNRVLTRNPEVVYVYYAPDTDKTLTVEEAEEKLAFLANQPFKPNTAHVDGHLLDA